MLKRNYKAVLLAVFLIGSLAANLLLFRSAWRYYREMNGIRLNPLGLSYYPTDEVQPVEKEAGQRLVVFYGDSRAAQWRFPKAPEMMANFVFVDRGINTQTSSQVAGRFEGHIRPLEPDVIVLQMCINDLKTLPLFPEAQERIIENCEANIQEIVTKSQEMGTTIILTTVFPYGAIPLERRLVWSDDVLPSIKEVNTFIESLAGEGVVVLDAYSILAGEEGLVKEAYRFEFLHINGQGYEALNEALAKILILVE